MNPTTKAFTQKHELARRYAEMGLYIFPVCPNEKIPLHMGGHKSATIDIHQIDKWWTDCPDANIGASPSDSGHCVIDIDVKHGIDGEKSLRSLESIYRKAPKTLVVTTPAGGRHLWFKGYLPSTVKKLGAGLDTRGKGGYVLMPGSVVDGQEYTGVVDLSEVADIPDWVLTQIRAREKQPAEGNPDLIDAPWNLKRAESYLKNLVKFGEVAVEGQGGNALTYQVAATLCDLGASEESAIELILENWNPHCEPPWDPEELHDATYSPIRHAFQYAQNEAGCLAVRDPVQVFAGIRRQNDDLKMDFKSLFESCSAPSIEYIQNLLNEKAHPPEELIEGLLEKGVANFLCGVGGSHKSRLGLQMGLSIASGFPFLNRRVEKANLVYLSSEDSRNEVSKRSQDIVSALGLPRDIGGHYWDRKDADSRLVVVGEGAECEVMPFFHELVSALNAIQGHKFVVMDSCYDFVGFKGKAKVDEGSVNFFVKKVLGNLCQLTNSTLLVIWHPSQAGSERADASGWSVAWHNAPRVRLSISKKGESSSAFELKVVKKNHGRIPDPEELYYCEGALSHLPARNDVERNAELIDAVVAVAAKAVETGMPIQQRGSFRQWQYQDLERKLGFKPTKSEFRETLAFALRDGKLHYIKTTRHRTAGYYPGSAEQAAEQAIEVKRNSKSTELNGEGSKK